MFMTVYDIVLWIGNESMKTVVIYNTINFFSHFCTFFLQPITDSSHYV